VRPGEVRLVKARQVEVRLDEVRLVEVRPGEVRPGEVRLVQIRQVEVRLAEGGADIGAPISPLGPGVHALLQPRDVLVVRHGSTLSATTLFWDGLAMRSIRLASLHADARLRADARSRDGGVR